MPLSEHQTQAKEARTLKKAVSTTFIKAPRAESEGNTSRNYARKKQTGGGSTSKSNSLRVRSTKARARESVCSRNSTISVMEYLAARKRLEDATVEEPLVPLSEYGRNCHVSMGLPPANNVPN